LAPVLSRLALADHPDIALSNSPGSDAFDVALPFIGPKHLSFRLEGEEFKFILPPEVTVRESDITYWLRPGQQGFGPSASGTRMTRENEATMFRELTWQGWVRVPAWFQARSPVRLQSGQREMLATLVLQGTGNGCMQETDFVKWVFWLGEFRVAGPVRVRP
jgi:hypothetical protein